MLQVRVESHRQKRRSNKVFALGCFPPLAERACALPLHNTTQHNSYMSKQAPRWCQEPNRRRALLEKQSYGCSRNETQRLTPGCRGGGCFVGRLLSTMRPSLLLGFNAFRWIQKRKGKKRNNNYIYACVRVKSREPIHSFFWGARDERAG